MTIAVHFFPFSTSTRISSLHKQTKLAAPEVLTLLHQVRSSVVKVFVSHRWLSGWWPGAPHEGSTWYREECERAATSAKQLKHEIAPLPGGSDWWRGHPDQQGHPKALAAFGYASPKVQLEALVIKKTSIELGEALEFSVCLKPLANKKQSLIVDYIIHHQKKNGQLTPKVFKWKKIDLEPDKPITITRSPIR